MYKEKAMKKNKLPTLLLCSVALMGSAQAAPPQSEVEQIVTSLSIMAGDAKGDLKLENTINRAEFTTMTVNLMSGDNAIPKPSVSPYPDVSRDHWASAYVAYGVTNGLISGYSDGTFRPGNQITLGEASVIIPNLLGYSASDFQGYTMDSRVAWMATAGLLDGVEAQTAATAITRKDTMYIFYNALTSPKKAGGTVLQTMGYTLSSDGEIDRTDLLRQLLEGPIIATGNWEADLPFTLSQAKEVYVGGKLASASDIRSGDLVYYIPATKTLWVYQEQVTGSIENIAINGTVTTLTISGKSYNVETELGKFELSSLGTYKKGDVVTALLGKDGGVARVVAPELGSAMLVGLVTESGVTTFTDNYGATYQGKAITVMATDGSFSTYSYDMTTNTPVGAVVEVAMGTNNEVTIKKGLSGQVNGQISTENRTMGSYQLASDLEILDVYEGVGVEIFLSRLDGLVIEKSDVAYHRMNARGEIDRLILKDVTGEMHSYGLLMSLTDGTSYSGYTAYYSCVLAPQGDMDFTLTKRFPVKAGGFVVKGSLTAPDDMKNLLHTEVTRLDTSSIIASNRVYPLAQNVVVMQKQGNKYYLTNLARLQETGYEKLSAYYASANDHYIRVLVAD